MVQCHLHITLGPSRRWYSMVQYHLWKGGPACSSKLNGTTLPSSPHSRSEPTPTSPRIQLTAVSRLCPLLPFSRFSSLRRSLLPPFSHCCRLFLPPPITRPRPKKDFRGGDKQLGVGVLWVECVLNSKRLIYKQTWNLSKKLHDPTRKITIFASNKTV